jgi:hypothetical protein
VAFWSGPQCFQTPTGLPRPDPDGVERAHLAVLGDADEVDPKVCANAGWQTLSNTTAVSGTTPAKIVAPSATAGIRWSSCPYSVSTSSPGTGRSAFRFGVRRWVPLVARTSTCFASSGPTLTRAGSYPTSRGSAESSAWAHGRESGNMTASVSRQAGWAEPNVETQPC